MWLSQVEIEHYSVANLVCITAFEALEDRPFVKGTVHTCSYVNVSSIHEFTQCI